MLLRLLLVASAFAAIACGGDPPMVQAPSREVGARDPSEPQPSANAAMPRVEAGHAKGVKKVSATEYEVDRAILDELLENPTALLGSSRIVPESEDGRVVGLRLVGLTASSLLGALGFENGDRVEAINGFDITSPDKALEAYTRLSTVDRLTVQVKRLGRSINLDYNIR